MRSWRLCFAVIVTVLLAVPAHGGGAKKKVLLLWQSPDGHPKDTHEYELSQRILKRELDRFPTLDPVLVNADDPWKDGPKLLADADGVVVYVSEGAKWLGANPDRLAAFQACARRKAGFAVLHWGMGTKDAKNIQPFVDLFGGCHGGPDRKYQVVSTEAKVAAPRHPIMSGLADFKVRDEFYYTLKFARTKTPLLNVTIDGEAHAVAWALERSDGGRSFGFSGLHFHENWQLADYRRLVTQGCCGPSTSQFPGAVSRANRTFSPPTGPSSSGYPMPRETQVPEQPKTSLPIQAEVYFKQYPAIELPRLQTFVNAREAGKPCEVRAAGADQENAEGRKVGTFAVFQAGMSIGVLVHNTPTEGLEMLRRSSLIDKVKIELLSHKAHALLTLVGGDELAPVERVLFLYKVAAGLCQQGAIGLGNIHTGQVLPGGVLRDLFGDALSASEMTVWESLREHGEPAELLVRFGMVELAGKRYLATIGFGYCGFFDLLWQYTSQEEAGEVSQMFRSLFTYQMENGPIIKAGHTFGYDDNVAFRFHDAPKGLEFPFPALGILVATKEESK